MPLSAALLQTLHNIVGDAGFVSNAHDIAPFLLESRNRFQGHCDVLLKPSSVEQVSEILSICDDGNIPVVPQGGNTGHCGGAVPDGGVLLNLSRLNKVRLLDEMNGSVSVDAGCILQDIQDVADRCGLYFPLSLASQGSCQIGGNLATNAGGVHVLRYGNMRDLVLGLEVVLPDGRIWDGMRALRKDNTGYDLKHLFIGSEGTLGVITGAVLKLFPRARDRVCLMAATDSTIHLMDIFHRMRDVFGDTLNAFEILPHFCLEIVQKHFPQTHNPFEQAHKWYCLIEVAAMRVDTGLMTALQGELTALMQDGYVTNAVIAQNEQQSADLWEMRELMSSAQKKEGGSIKHDVSVPVSKIVDFIRETTQTCQNLMPNARICAFGHAGDGNIHFNISQPVTMDKNEFLDKWPEFNDIVHEMAERFGGSFSAEHGIGLLKTTEMERYRSGPEIDMMHLIKKNFDPNNIMNPGKVLKAD